ncbi:RNA polymerase sigma factor [Spirosoma soli]|uniref:RNA polymerase sigma factor n=1 Tax=Spirosoma soli TaxID=1770529 RepID=A0ABW5M8U2_9BACT
MKKSKITDEQLADTFVTYQSAESFSVLYNRYIHKVYKTCFTLTKDVSAAEDYTQDIFIKVFERLGSFRNRSSFSSWLYAISYHYCLDRIRLNKRMLVEPLPDEVTGEIETCALDFDGVEGTDLRLSALDRALRHLSAKEIELLTLKYEQGLSVQALSKRYQLSESAVKMRLKRTRDKLQQLYVEPGL